MSQVTLGRGIAEPVGGIGHACEIVDVDAACLLATASTGRPVLPVAHGQPSAAAGRWVDTRSRSFSRFELSPEQCVTRMRVAECQPCDANQFQDRRRACEVR